MPTDLRMVHRGRVAIAGRDNFLDLGSSGKCLDKSTANATGPACDYDIHYLVMATHPSVPSAHPAPATGRCRAVFFTPDYRQHVAGCMQHHAFQTDAGMAMSGNKTPRRAYCLKTTWHPLSYPWRLPQQPHCLSWTGASHRHSYNYPLR